jgi:dienelactone hydrolase
MSHAQTLQEISYQSTADNTMQPAMFYRPDGDGPIPLIVALHTWGGDYRQDHHNEIADWCIDNGWAHIHPDFRGPNRRPEATGSDLVIADIASAVDYAVEAAGVDTTAVYLVGTSGGGYAALLMAGRHPEIWAGVTAWVPISDLAAWYAQCKSRGLDYQHDIAASCGGAPGDSREIDVSYRTR